MPNWCSTTVHITSPAIEKIEDALKDALEKNYLEDVPFSFRNNWLGNLLIYTGMTLDEVCNGDSPCCRGEITFDEETGPLEYTIDMETAWSPQLGALVKFLEYLEVDYHLTYTASEPGCGLFVTNDPDCVGKFMFDDFNGYVDYDLSEDAFRATVRDYFSGNDDVDLAEFDALPAEKLADWVCANAENATAAMYEYSPVYEWCE